MSTLFDQADARNLRVPTSCGRSGLCHECIVEVTGGADNLEPRTSAEAFLRGEYRLACQARLRDENTAVAFAPLVRRPRILTSSPAVPTAIDPPGREGLGLALDLGTTTVVFELIELSTGAPRLAASFENPQRFGGSDVMHRISYDARQPGELARAFRAALNQRLKEACATLNIDRQQIREMVVAGNSTMRDLFFGLDVQSIGQRPYKSVTEHEMLAGRRATTALEDRAHALGVLIHPQALVYGVPLIASHVGGDAAACLAAIGWDHAQPVMLVDIGTNTEVIAGYGDEWICASCPAGPAFEGGLVRYGMPGADGAIERIRRVGEGWAIDTIGNVSPEGICGSGLIDLLAELSRHHLMTPKGVFPNRAREVVIHAASGIGLSREDASNLAQAKAANYCGQFIVLRTAGIAPEDVSTLYLAGGFAHHIDTANAVEIGFLAPVPLERVVKLGNAALAGARCLLLSHALRRRLEAFVPRIRHVELETTPDFFDLFVEGCQFKPFPKEFVACAQPASTAISS